MAPDACVRSRVWNEHEDRWYGILTSGCAHVNMRKHPADICLNLNRLLWRVNFSLLSLLLVWQLHVLLIYTVWYNVSQNKMRYSHTSQPFLPFLQLLFEVLLISTSSKLLFMYEGYPSLQYVQPGLYTAEGLSASSLHFFSSADVFETQCPLSSILSHLRSAQLIVAGNTKFKRFDLKNLNNFTMCVPAPPGLWPCVGELAPWCPAFARRPWSWSSVSPTPAGPHHAASPDSHTDCETAPSQPAESAQITHTRTHTQGEKDGETLVQFAFSHCVSKGES